MSTGIKVKDAMVKGVVIGMIDQNVLEGSKIMTKHDVGSLIVCDGEKPAGIVTREDVINKVVSTESDPSKVMLKDIMSKNLVTVTSDQDISEAARLMSKYMYERIPVVSLGKLVGIISTREIAKVAPAALEIATEHLRIEEGTDEDSEKEEEVTSGECESCGNFTDQLQKINDQWICSSCREGN